MFNGNLFVFFCSCTNTFLPIHSNVLKEVTFQCGKLGETWNLCCVQCMLLNYDWTSSLYAFLWMSAFRRMWGSYPSQKSGEWSTAPVNSIIKAQIKIPAQCWFCHSNKGWFNLILFIMLILLAISLRLFIFYFPFILSHRVMFLSVNQSPTWNLLHQPRLYKPVFPVLIWQLLRQLVDLET